jgi:hypothetical protein
MELNLLVFGYLFLRLAPFILVCFFSLTSIFNQDFKGIVYLVGLLGACFSSIMIGKMFGIKTNEERPAICSMVTLGQQELSSLPLGQTIFGYTFEYLLYVIVKYKYVLQNIPTIVFFPLLILFDFYWNSTNNCYSSISILLSLITGASIGAMWAYIIDKTNAKTLQYFAGVNNNETCQKPANQTFKCNVYKNGQLISGNEDNEDNSDSPDEMPE